MLADADLNGAIAPGVARRNENVNFRSAEDVPLEGLDDLAVLHIAAVDQRILVSHDRRTMQVHFREYTLHRSSPGLILIPQSLNIGTAVENLVFVCEALDASDLENRICLFPSLVIFGFGR